MVRTGLVWFEEDLGIGINLMMLAPGRHCQQFKVLVVAVSIPSRKGNLTNLALLSLHCSLATLFLYYRSVMPLTSLTREEVDLLPRLPRYRHAGPSSHIAHRVAFNFTRQPSILWSAGSTACMVAWWHGGMDDKIRGMLPPPSQAPKNLHEPTPEG